MSKMTKDEQRTHIRTRAQELARSGEYSDYTTIEMVIRKEGFPEARHVLDDRFFREELNNLCNASKEKP